MNTHFPDIPLTLTLTFNDYEVWSRTTAIYPGALTGGPDELAYLALGLTGEAGEVANKIKKYLRGEHLDAAAVRAELGDVLWYLARLACAVDADFGTIARQNIDKLERRKQENTLRGDGDNR